MKYYRRNADVVYPVVTCPFDQNILVPIRNNPYFIVISRLSEYKNVALAIETCNKLQLDLVVIGEGKEYHSLKKIAGPHITIIGWVNEQEKWQYLKNARALLFPAEDDLGIVCVEALCVNVPVVALGRGGACEIIDNGKTGELFDAPTVEMMADGLRRFLEREGLYDTSAMEETVQNFSREKFRTHIQEIITHEST
jgi:glycosyltransferase involved in cell wall biosynthesis